MAKSRDSGEKWWNVVKSGEKLEKVGKRWGKMGKSGEK